MWTFVKIWGVAGIIYVSVLLSVNNQGVPATIAAVAALGVVWLGYTEDAIKRLWRYKKDKPRDEIED